MGYYIQTNSNLGKANELIQTRGAVRATKQEAKASLNSTELAPLVVVNNGFFEAVAFCFSESEFEAFTLPHDIRPKEFLLMDRKVVEELSGYNAR